MACSVRTERLSLAPAGIGGPLDDEEGALPGFDVLEQDQQEVLGRVVPWLARLGYRSQDRRGCTMESSCQRVAGLRRAVKLVAGRCDWVPVSMMWALTVIWSAMARPGVGKHR
jgi:hypothetical protein